MKQEINYRKRNEKNIIWRLNNMLFKKNHCVNDEIKELIKKYLETNDDENTTQNLQDEARAVLTGSS